jgi:DNA-binding PadR family transcriptional regulator
MTSPVNWAVLGLVIARPSYGLELYNRYQRVYADVHPISEPSHAYSALDALASRGLIETEPRVNIGRQPKPHYRATPLGISSYENWLVEQIEVEDRRQEMWVRQLAIFAHDPGSALKVLSRYRDRCLKLASRKGSERQDSVIDSRGALIEELVAERHRIASGGMLSWLRFAYARFEDRAGSVAQDDPAQT